MGKYRSKFPEHTNYAEVIKNGPYLGFMYYGFCISLTRMSCYPKTYGIKNFYTFQSPIDDYISITAYFGKKAIEIKISDYGKRPSKLQWDIQTWWWINKYSIIKRMKSFYHN